MSRSRTRMVELARPQARARAVNLGTVIASVPPDRQAAPFRHLFLAHYDRLRATCLGFAEPGLAVFAFDRATGGWLGSMALASRAGQVRAGVVGRHSAAALFLDGDPTLALRHLAFLVEPPSPRDAARGEVRFRVLDLQTGSPPRDEGGRSVASLTAEGAVFLDCQGHTLMAFVTGDPTDWPERADDAWACIPERVFVEERLASPTGSAPQPLPSPPLWAALARRSTFVRLHAGPRRAGGADLCGDDLLHGHLGVTSGGRQEWIPVGREALRCGVLIGRYPRCATTGRLPIADASVSRVHLLLVELGGRACAIDLASSNGTYRIDRGGEPLTAAVIDDREGLLLGDDTVIAWSPAAR
jgi:hypothetical protein